MNVWLLRHVIVMENVERNATDACKVPENNRTDRRFSERINSDHIFTDRINLESDNPQTPGQLPHIAGKKTSSGERGSPVHLSKNSYYS